MAFRLAFALVAATAFAGCGAKDGLANVKIDETSDVDDVTGAIHGFVLDLEALPIAQAELLLLPGERLASTDATGAYGYDHIDPGTYTLAVSRVGFLDTTIQSQVRAGQVTVTNVTLEAVLLAAEPRTEVLGPFEGYMQCNWALGFFLLPRENGPCGTFPYLGEVGPITQLWQNDKMYYDFRISGDDWQAIFFEATWTTGTHSTSPNMMLFFSYAERGPDHFFGSSTPQKGPLKWTYVRTGDVAPPHLDSNSTLRAWLNVPTANGYFPFEAALDVRFEITVSVFYNQGVPEEYSALDS